MADSSKESVKENITIYSFNGQDFKDLLRAGMTWLKSNQPLVNSLNVFPVPDGDTGTNMFLTMQSAFNEIKDSQDQNIGRISHQIAQGALMGARGNSGVILSQIFRGFARALDENDSMDSELFVKALSKSRDTAYKGVVRPVEGTILTVIKDIAKAAEDANNDTKNLFPFLEAVVEAADASVEKTPDLLPILKQAGVVDSGGKGLFFIFEGMLRMLRRESLEEEAASEAVQFDISKIETGAIHDSIEPGQDFEVVVDFQPKADFNTDFFYEKLNAIGTSIQLGEGDNMYRMHIHVPSDNKYQPIDLVMEHGVVQKVYIENLMEQMKENSSNGINGIQCKNDIKEGQVALIAISPGDGISKIFQSLSITQVIAGGQTMNPSTEEILAAFQNLPVEQVIILPNNKNIILAAESAASMTKKKVAVIPSNSIPQGISAALCYSPDGDFEQMTAEMKEALSEADTAEITTATRSIAINGVDVKEGEVIALFNGELVGSSKSLEQSYMAIMQKIDVNEREHITVFYGNEVSEAETKSLCEKISKKYPDFEIELHYGGQPHYQFIVSIE